MPLPGLSDLTQRDGDIRVLRAVLARAVLAHFLKIAYTTAYTVPCP
jgi:hypothetical protein